jgi:hypothetical protein
VYRSGAEDIASYMPSERFCEDRSLRARARKNRQSRNAG